MRLPVLALTVFVASAGCAAARVRAQAAPTLGCDAEQISLEQRELPKGAWVASGCGRLAICTLHAEPDSEVACAGGAPVTYSALSYEPSPPVAAVHPALKPRPLIPAWVGERGAGARKARLHAKAAPQ